jgi:hypothetical protein
MRGNMEIVNAIMHHDLKIARNVLAQFINLGSNETGSYALADVQTKTFMQCEEGVASYIASVLNTDAIPELVDYNYDGVSIYPTVEFEPLADTDVKDISLAIQNMASFISNDPGFEDYVRKLVGAPSAPKDVVVATNPTAPDKDAKQPGSQAQETKPAKPGIPENPADEVGDGKTQASSATAAGLVEHSDSVDTRLLNEALSAIYGRDATERGVRHIARLAEQRVTAAAVCDCSPETPAVECTCAADCVCRADGGSCSTSQSTQLADRETARMLSMEYEASIVALEHEIADLLVERRELLGEADDTEVWTLANNYPRQKGGKFGFGPGTTAYSRLNAAHESLKAEHERLKAERDRLKTENEALKAGGTQTTTHGGGRSGTSTPKEAEPKVEIKQRVPISDAQYSWVVTHGSPAQLVLATYGRDQMPSVLRSSYTMSGLRDMQQGLGLSGGRSKGDVVNSIMSGVANISEADAYQWALANIPENPVYR